MDAPPGSPKEDLAVLRDIYEATNGYRWKIVWDLDQARTAGTALQGPVVVNFCAYCYR
jgi:hypothetical protein